MNIKAPTSKPSCVLGSLFVDGSGGGSAAFKRLCALDVQAGCFGGPLRTIWDEAQKLEASRPGWVPFELVEVLEGLEDAADILKAVEVAKDDATNYPERVERFARDLAVADWRSWFLLALRRARDACMAGEDTSTAVAEIVKLQERASRTSAGVALTLVRDDVFCARHTPLPAPVIDGLADRGEVTLLVGAPKEGKSWAALQGAKAIASGGTFLRWRARSGLVVYVNTEVGEAYWEERSRNLNQALGIDAAPLLYHVNIRGKLFTSETLLPCLREALAQEKISDVAAFFFDSFYTLAGDLDEKESRDVSGMMLAFQALAEEFGAAVFVVHHFKKDGKKRAAGQDLLDRASGSGVFARAVDNFMAFTESNGKMILQVRRRNSPAPVALEVVLRGQRWEVVGDAPPDFDKGRRGRRVTFTPDFVVGKWRSADAVMTWTDLKNSGIGKGSLAAAVERARDAGLIEKSGDGYRLTAEGKKVRLGHGPESTETP